VGLSLRPGREKVNTSRGAVRLGAGLENARLSLGRARTSVGPSDLEHHICLGRTGLRVSIPRDVLAAARARAQVLGEWTRAPVISGR